MIRLLYFIFIVGLCACNSRGEASRKTETTFNEFDINEVRKLKQRVMAGDTLAYEMLSVYYIDYQVSGEFLFYSLVMANKYNYPLSYYDVFFNICMMYNHDVDRMDNGFAKMAFQYLLRGAQLGHHQAKKAIDRLGVNVKEDDDPKAALKLILAED